MVVRKIPKKQEAFIEGKREESKQRKELRKLHNVLVRIPDDMHRKIDVAINERPIKVSRNMWILEAINSHLE